MIDPGIEERGREQKRGRERERIKIRKRKVQEQIKEKKELSVLDEDDVDVHIYIYVYMDMDIDIYIRVCMDNENKVGIREKGGSAFFRDIWVLSFIVRCVCECVRVRVCVCMCVSVCVVRTSPEKKQVGSRSWRAEEEWIDQGNKDSQDWSPRIHVYQSPTGHFVVECSHGQSIGAFTHACVSWHR